MTQKNTFPSSKDLDKLFKRSAYFKVGTDTLKVGDDVSYPILADFAFDKWSPAEASFLIGKLCKAPFSDARRLHAYILSRSVPFDLNAVQAILKANKQTDKLTQVQEIVNLYTKEAATKFSEVTSSYIFYGDFETIEKEFFNNSSSFLFPAVSAISFKTDEWVVLEYAKFLLFSLSLSLHVYPIFNNSMYLVAPTPLEIDKMSQTSHYYHFQESLASSKEYGLEAARDFVSEFFVSYLGFIESFIDGFVLFNETSTASNAKTVAALEAKITELQNQLAVHQTILVPQTEVAQQISW